MTKLLALDYPLIYHVVSDSFTAAAKDSPDKNDVLRRVFDRRQPAGDR